MSRDDDGEEDAAGPEPPPSPDDRLWRHPSEVSSFGRARCPTPEVPVPVLAPESRAPVWPIALVAGFVGAALCGGVLAVTGNLSVETERAVERVQVTPFVPSPLFTDDQTVDALKDRVSPAVVRLDVTTPDGEARVCGVVMRDDGVVVTSADDIADATAITVVLHDGRTVEAELVGFDLPTDVGVVRIEADGLTVAVLGDPDELETGRAVVALGTTSAGDLAVSAGVISALGQRLDAGGETLYGLIQTDAPIEASWSGGPVVDATGAVIGISNDLAGDRTRFGFATPMALVHLLADELLATGKVAHGWLGIEARDLSQARSDDVGIDAGADVRQVKAGSPAGDAGLAEGDVITQVAGEPVRSSSDLVVLLRQHKPDDVVVIDYWRNGRHHEAEVTIEHHPDW